MQYLNNDLLVLKEAFVIAVFDNPDDDGVTTFVATLDVGDRDDRTIPSGLSSLS